MKKYFKDGISLIVLVITIIIIAILAVAVITTISNSDIMSAARQSTFKQDMKQYQEMYGLWYAANAAKNEELAGLTVNASYDADSSGLYAQIFGANVPDKYIQELKVEDGRVVYYTTNEERKEIITLLGMSPSAMSITNTLSNCTNTNAALNVEYGESYVAALMADPGYVIYNVAITMGGEDITSNVYNVSTGEISIPCVTGKLVINATTEPDTFIVNNTLTNANTSNLETQVTGATNYVAKLTPKPGYTLTGATVIITMNGSDVTESSYTPSTGDILISNVIGNISITAYMPAGTYTVNNNLNGCTSNNILANVSGATSYTATLSANVGRAISFVTVMMGGVNVTSTYYNSTSHVISIISVTGDIEITAMTSPITYQISNTLTDCTNNNSNVNASHGSNYLATISPNVGKNISSVTVTMGGVDITNSCYNSLSHIINISNVTGNIVITANTVAITYSITNSLIGCTNMNMDTSITYGSNYTALLVPENGFTLEENDVFVMVGTDIIEGAYDGQTGVISLSNVTGDITISATALIGL